MEFCRPFGQRRTRQVLAESCTINPPSSCPPVRPEFESCQACVSAVRIAGSFKIDLYEGGLGASIAEIIRPFGKELRQCLWS